MVESTEKQDLSEWQPYALDYHAQELVLKHRNENNVLNESHKMRMTVAYGLERFWGEQLRLGRDKKTRNKSQYWQDVWHKLAEILQPAGINLPNDDVTSTLPEHTREQKKAKEKDETQKIQAMAKKIWSMSLPEQRIALMVLTQFCDALVWWTQRYRP